MGRVLFRLCRKRPELGFDMHWHWGEWDETVKFWWRARNEPGSDLLYVQRSAKGSGIVESEALDLALMSREAARLHLDYAESGRAYESGRA